MTRPFFLDYIKYKLSYKPIAIKITLKGAIYLKTLCCHFTDSLQNFVMCFLLNLNAAENQSLSVVFSRPI